MNEELKIIISAEISKLQQNIQKAKNTVNGFKDKVKEASKNVDSNFKAIGGAIASVGPKIAAGLAAAGTALLALGASTAEYRAEQAKLVSAFETAGSSAAVAKETYNDLYRVLGDGGVAVEAANHLAKLTTEEKALSEWTNICQGVYATFGASLPIEGLTEAVNHTAQLGEVQGPLADALEWCGITTDSFNEKLAECSTLEEREKLIRKTLNGLYSEAASTYEKNNSEVLKQNEANARLQETTAKLGEAIAPVVTAFTNFANEALAKVTPYIADLASTYMPQLEALLGTITEALANAFTWVQQHQTLLAVMAGIITGIVVAIGLYNAVAAIKAAMDTLQVTTLGGLIAAYLAQAAAMLVAIAPYVLIVAAIAAVIAIIVVCVKHWDEIKAKVKEVWNNIKQATQQAVTNVVNKFNELKTKASEKVEQLKKAASDKFNALKQAASDKVEQAKTAIVNKFTEIKTNISNKVTEAKTALVNGFTNMVTSAQQKCENIVSAVKSKFESVVSNIKDKMNSAKETIKSIIDAIVGFFSGAKFSWPKISLPHFSISPSGWKIGDLLKGVIPKLSISWYAKGGVFDDPTLFGYGGRLGGLGENGAEAIVPLEKNTKWLDRIASMLEEKMGADKPIVLNVDGQVFAKTAIRTINQQTKQTGKLALTLV